MDESANWMPSASLERLQLRARLLSAVRRFFDARGYFEVDTPLVSHERVVDAHLEPFIVTGASGTGTGGVPAGGEGEARLYLQTSPEFAMKRLLAAGAQAIYQIAHVFRHGEFGRLHNPEFTMVEWYRVGDSCDDQMQVVEDLTLAICEECRTSPRPSSPFARSSYRSVFMRHAGSDLSRMNAAQIVSWAHGRGLHPPPGLVQDDRDGWLNWLLAELVEPNLGAERPEFVYDYPASQAALARIRAGDPPVAERFELYWRGVELCNGYRELTDADELRTRIDAESSRRERDGLGPLPLPPRLLEAMRSGLPECSGVALGFDRLMLAATGADAIHDVMPFSFDQA